MFKPVGRVGEFLLVDSEPPRPVYVNVNTCTRFQEIYGQSIFAIIPTLVRTLTDVGIRAEGDGQANILALAALDLRALHYLAAAALHGYKNGEPIYDLTPGRLGGMLTFEQWADLAKLVMKGLGDFLPKPGDGPPSQEKTNGRPTEGSTPIETHSGINGGLPYTPSRAAILGSLTSSTDEPHSGQSGSDGELTSSAKLNEM